VFSLKQSVRKEKAEEKPEENKDKEQPDNPKSSLAFMKGILPKYFSSEWSFAQFRVPEQRTIVAFGAEKNSIIAVSWTGSFYKAIFDPDKPPVRNAPMIPTPSSSTLPIPPKHQWWRLPLSESLRERRK